MADTNESLPPESGAPISNTANQARLRKERREAKIRSGGSARLNRITGLSGVRRDFSTPDPPQVHADPGEVDISNYIFESNNASSRTEDNSDSPPAIGASGVNEDVLRQMMLGINSKEFGPGGDPTFGTGLNNPTDFDDPMMKVFQQMLNGTSGEGMGGLPSFPGFENQSQPAPVSSYAYVWRIVHAVFALSLGLFIALTTQFTGTKLERERSAIGYNSPDSEILTSRPTHFFYIFVVAEVLLLSTRSLLDKKQVKPEGILGMAIGFIPEPFKQYLLLAMKYFSIWATVSQDAMVCIFVVGVYAWMKNGEKNKVT